MAGRITIIFMLSLSIVMNLSCSKPKATEPSVVSSADEAAMDSTVNPCDDFYEYACGGWIKATTIPEDRAQWSRSFSEIDEKNLLRLKQILSRYSDGESIPPVPEVRKLGDFYGVCLDEQKAETASMRTFQEWSDQIAMIREKRELAGLLAKLQLSGVNAFFAIGSEQDLRDSNVIIAAFDQGGLGLPDREYYFSPKLRGIRIEYRDHIKRMMRLLGKTASQANQTAAVVLQVETLLAQNTMSPVERRSPEKTFHPMKRVDLERTCPVISWKEYFDALGYPEIQTIDVKTPVFFSSLDKTIGKTSVEDLRTYLIWHLLEGSAPALGKAFVNEQFRFQSHGLSGQKMLEPRWKRCVSAAIEGMGFALGRAFVADFYKEDQKQLARGMVEAIESRFHSDLEQVAWMDETTRSEAIRKLNRVVNQIGYPEKWRSYNGLQIDRESYLKNRLEADAFNAKYELDKIGKPTDRTDWDMPPEVANAYYDPSMNKMVFPAAIFESPLFDPKMPSLANFSGIGMVMGHELTHGFDDEGRKFDAEGRLRDWWTPQAAKDFKERVECVIKQYGNYQIPEGEHLNGALTAGENIADMGGIRTAYAAWIGASGLSPAISQKRDFFIHFAQSWCTKTQAKLALTSVLIDPHSPPRFRVNGPLANLESFGEVFGCPLGKAMNPISRCTVW